MVMEAGANLNQLVIRRNRPGTSAKVSESWSLFVSSYHLCQYTAGSNRIALEIKETKNSGLGEKKKFSLNFLIKMFSFAILGILWMAG